MLDLSTLAPTTVPLEIRNPSTGKPTGLVLHLLSRDSEPVLKVKRSQTTKAIARRNRKVTAADLEENETEIYAACVESWDWKGEAAWTGGKKPEFKPENVRSVVSTPWIRTQIEEVMNDEAAFFSRAE